MKTILFAKEDESHETFSSALRKNVYNYFKENHISPNANATMVIKTIANLSASQHPESIVTHPYQRTS